MSKREITYTNTYRSTFEFYIAMKIVSDSSRNIVTMPLTVRMALCKLAHSVAQEPAKEEILRVFYRPSYKVSCYSEVSDIIEMLVAFPIVVINKIYVNDSRDLNPIYLDNSAERFGVHVQKMGFIKPSAVRTYINNWFEQVSLRRIRDVLNPEDVNDDTSILLLSAAHFKTTWESGKFFNVFDTKPMNFRTLNGSIVKVPMMTLSAELLYYHDKQGRFQLVKIPLYAYGITITLIVGDLKTHFQSMLKWLARDPSILQKARKNMRYDTVEILVPRFRIESSFTWDDALKQFGVEHVFNTNNSGLDGLLRSHNDVRHMFLSKVKQKIVLDMDETGVLRSIFTKETSEQDKMEQSQSAGYKAKKFRADHPFLFTIDLQVSPFGDQTMFALGTYYGPESEAS